MLQWFASVVGFKEQALAAIKGVQWVPASGETRIRNMTEGRADWCISRQRKWACPYRSSTSRTQVTRLVPGPCSAMPCFLLPCPVSAPVFYFKDSRDSPGPRALLSNALLSSALPCLSSTSRTQVTHPVPGPCSAMPCLLLPCPVSAPVFYFEDSGDSFGPRALLSNALLSSALPCQCVHLNLGLSLSAVCSAAVVNVMCFHKVLCTSCSLLRLLSTDLHYVCTCSSCSDSTAAVCAVATKT